MYPERKAAVLWAFVLPRSAKGLPASRVNDLFKRSLTFRSPRLLDKYRASDLPFFLVPERPGSLDA